MCNHIFIVSDLVEVKNPELSGQDLLLLFVNFIKIKSNYYFNLKSGTIRNQRVDTDPTVHQNIHHQDTNILVVLTAKMKVVQKENIIEKVHLPVMIQITPILPLKITNLKVPNHSMITKEIKGYNQIHCIPSKMIHWL